MTSPLPTRTAWSLGAFYFFYFAYVGGFTPYLSLYFDSVGMTAVQIGLLMAVNQSSRMFAPMLWGVLADRRGSRMHIVRLTALAGGIAMFGLFAGNSFLAMFITLAVMSAFTSATMPLAEATTFGHVRGDTGRYARIRLWGSVGFIFSVVGIGYFLDFATLRDWLWLVIAIYAVALVATWQVPESAAHRAAREDVPARSILKRPEVAGLLGACFLMATAHGAYYSFFSVHLVDNGYSKSAVGWLWALGVVCEVAVFWWMPQLVARIGLYRLLVATFAIAVLRFLLIGWLVQSPVALVLAQTMHAATFGAYHAAAIGLIHRWFQGAHQAKGQALYTALSFGAGGTLGGFASGLAWSAYGPAVTFTLAAVAAALGFLLLLASVRGRVPDHPPPAG
ncbi:MAG: MFS transporter [bacterium]|jgi:PPP family 3-phenylpropionic acid transporter|nr:MFS transporter [Betaproteobacteria bacterium]